MLRHLVVVGLGLIGGSLAACAKQRGLAKNVIGIARRQAVCEQALQLNIVDEGYNSIESIAKKLGKNDLVFIAVPTLAMRETLATLKEYLPDSVTITDGASVKGSVRDDVLSVYGCFPPQVVLGHPIAGSEKSGVLAATPTLYEQHRVILTPWPDQKDSDHVKQVSELWQSCGAEVLQMDVDDHDEVLAATSHLPHVIAFSLVDTLAHDSQNENIFRYAAGGFRDFTRIASSDAIMWRDIMLANKSAIIDAIDLFSQNLASLKSMIESENATDITGVFTRAKAARERFTRMLAHQPYQQKTEDETGMLNYKVAPGGLAQGTLRVPGDKSISHRSIMLGALAEGDTHIKGFLEGEDALATLQTFRDLGVVIEGPNDGEVTVHGVGLNGLQAPSGPLYVGNSGTSMRLMAGILAGQTFDSELTGDDSLSKRPMNRVANPLREMGANIDTGEDGRPPLKVHGGAPLKGIHYSLPMASAQVKSCVLLAALYAQGDTSVTEPAPTRDHTERMLEGFGYPLKREGATVAITPNGKLTACDIDIPADISSAAFFMVAAAITPGSDITLSHVGINPTRTGVIDILRLMGANISLSNEREVGGEPVADIRIIYAPLKGIEIPESLVPLAIDEFPALFIAAACAEGKTSLSGAEELRVKETDRIQAMADGLTTLGIQCLPTPDGIQIDGGEMGGGEVESHHDHRIAMSFTIAALRATAPVIVKNCANVATSFPNFTECAAKIGISLEVFAS